MNKTFAIFGGNANPALTAALCASLGVEPGKCKVSKFSDGEIQVEIGENVRGLTCFVCQPTCAPTNDNLMELLIMVDALKRASAGSIVAVIPYYGYARQERKAKPRTPITARLVADMLEAAGVNRVVSLDLHADQIQGFFKVPVDNLYATPIFRPMLRENKIGGDGWCVVSPDVGGIKRARIYSKNLACPLAMIDKRRDANVANVSEVMHLIGDVAGKRCLLVDDMIDTAGTLCNAGRALLANGATEVSALATHGVFSGKAFENIEGGPFKRVWVTDSTPVESRVTYEDEFGEPALTRAGEVIGVVSVAPLLAEAVKRIMNGDSISSLGPE